MFAGVLVATVSIAPPASAQKGRRPMTFEDFAAVRGVSDPQISPDGRSVLYAVRTMNLETNKRPAGTFLLSLAGGTPKPFPTEGVSAGEARWSPDGSKVAYTSGGQLWVADASGANARQITLFDSVGFAIEDFSALRDLRDRLTEGRFYEELDLLADPDEPRDLFGMLLRSIKA